MELNVVKEVTKMKNNSNGGKESDSIGVNLPPLPADAEYRKEHQQQEALGDPTVEQNLGNNKNKEAPSNVSGAEPIKYSVSDNSNNVQKDTYNPTTWQMFHDL
jgi:hypothetical protein